MYMGTTSMEEAERKRLVGSLIIRFKKEPYKRDNILQKRVVEKDLCTWREPRTHVKRDVYIHEKRYVNICT